MIRSDQGDQGDQIIADLLTRIDAMATIAAEFPNAPGLDCYIRGCHSAIYLSTRSQRHGLVTTCPGHDPHKWGDGADLDPYAWITAPRPKGDQGDQEPDQGASDQDATWPKTDGDRALAFIRALLRLAQGDQGAGSNDGGGGTREPRRPIPPQGDGGATADAIHFGF